MLPSNYVASGAITRCLKYDHGDGSDLKFSLSSVFDGLQDLESLGVHFSDDCAIGQLSPLYLGDCRRLRTFNISGPPWRPLPINL